MKFAITGAAGNISRPLVIQLLKAGHSVTAIGRNPDHLNELARAGARTATGSVEDPAFVKKAFAGADAVYTMYPPDISVKDLAAYCENIADNYANAFVVNNIKRVVNLSSIGAHLLKGSGHITGVQRAEARLNQLKDVNILHLRPVYFYTNLFANLDLIGNSGIMGSNFSIPSKKFPLTHPDDIADVAATALMKREFTGHHFQYIASDERGTDEIASVIGQAIGKPDLHWIKFTDEQLSTALTHAGFSEEIIPDFIEGFNAFNTDKFFEDYWAHHPENLGPTQLEDFAKVFAMVYNTKQEILKQV